MKCSIFYNGNFCFFQIVKYKLDRYIIRDANIEPLGSLGEGESFRTLQDISVSENKARQTLTQVCPTVFYMILFST